MKINFLNLGGAFCTRRNSTAIPTIIAKIEEAIKANESVICDWNGVKILTPSFVDEIIPHLIIKYGEEKINSLVSFDPKLEGFLAEQILRGVNARKSV